MLSRGNRERWRGAVCDWLVASRLLFGEARGLYGHLPRFYREESVSLRLCDNLESILDSAEPRNGLIESGPEMMDIECRKKFVENR